MSGLKIYFKMCFFLRGTCAALCSKFGFNQIIRVPIPLGEKLDGLGMFWSQVVQVAAR